MQVHWKKWHEQNRVSEILYGYKLWAIMPIHIRIINTYLQCEVGHAENRVNYTK